MSALWLRGCSYTFKPLQMSFSGKYANHELKRSRCHRQSFGTVTFHAARAYIDILNEVAKINAAVGTKHSSEKGRDESVNACWSELCERGDRAVSICTSSITFIFDSGKLLLHSDKELCGREKMLQYLLEIMTILLFCSVNCVGIICCPSV